jgi:hypothetical protein
MNEDVKDAEEFVKEAYDLDLACSYVELGEVGDLTYSVAEFVDNEILYQLIYIPDEELPNADDLLKFIQQVETRSVKKWERISSRSKHKNYTLYKLVPYTVQGVPQY